MEVRKKYYILTVCFIVLVVGFSVFFLNELKTEINKSKQQQQVLAVTKNSFKLPEFDKELFDKNINRVKVNPYQINHKIVAAVIPHHPPAGFMIADLFQKAASQGIKKVIILGPNHEELGSSSIHTTGSNWLTPFGLVLTNETLVNKIAETNVARKDPTVFEYEQSIYALTPYIKFYLPDADIVPILFKKSASISEQEKLINSLTSIIDGETLIVASVDFSHYLDKQTANQKDEETLELIKKQDLTTLQTLTSDHLDSAPSISVVLQLMNKLEKNKMNVIDHKNSDDIYGVLSPATTSYFYITFH